MVLLSHQRLQVWDCLLTQAIKSSTAGANERSGICLKQQPKPTVYTYARQYAQKVLSILIMCIVAILDSSSWHNASKCKLQSTSKSKASRILLHLK